MAEKHPNPKQGAGECTSRFLRDVNILGALAIGGAAVLAPPIAAASLAAWAGLNAAQAGGFEVARRHFAKKKRRS